MYEQMKPKEGEPGWKRWNQLREYMNVEQRNSLLDIVQKGIQYAMEFLEVEEEDSDYDDLVARCYETILHHALTSCLTADAERSRSWNPDPEKRTNKARLYHFSIGDSKLRMQIEEEFSDWYEISEEKEDYRA